MLKNVTLSADKDLIERARQRATNSKTTLNAAFREWLARFASDPDAGRRFDNLLKKLSPAKAGKRFTRDELNER